MEDLTTMSNGVTGIGCSVKKPFYSDCKDYSHLEPTDQETVKECLESGCVSCGSFQVTITEDADICHDCGYVYT